MTALVRRGTTNHAAIAALGDNRDMVFAAKFDEFSNFLR